MDKEESILQEKEQIIKDFFMSLKVTFKNATIYNMDHPAFIKSVEDLQKRIQTIHGFMNPISIGFTPRSLFMDETFWEGEKIYQELGRLFHFRKVKSMEIRQGISYKELMRFASKITLALKDFLREGGAEEILKKENIRHIQVEELDYSMLLKGEGEEISDIWAYLMEEALDEDDPQKLAQVADNFEDVIGKFNTEDLIVNEELHKNFSKFFRYLKETEEEKYRKCAKNLVKSVTTNRKITYESKFENLKLLISDLNEEELASTLWEEIITDDKFDSLSFSIFSKLIEKDRHLEISTSLRDLFQSDDAANRRPEVEEKIKALLAGTSSQFISDIYRQTLATLLDEISFDKKMTFDHHQLQRNYRFILINTLEKETRVEDMVEGLDVIFDHWKEITEEKDYEYVKCLYEVLLNKERDLAGEERLQKSKNTIAEFIEDVILEGNSHPLFEYFLRQFKTSAFDVNTYLERIFTDKKVTSYVLKAFFKFFTEYLFYFNINIEQNISDTEFIPLLIDCLKTIDTPVSLVTLKHIFAAGNPAIRLKVLKAMQNLTESDDKFLMPILKFKDMELKAEAVSLLYRNPNIRYELFNRLFNIPSPYGFNNKLLIKHIKIVEDKGIKEANDHLLSLGERKGFWNRKLRSEILRVLEKWNAG